MRDHPTQGVAFVEFKQIATGNVTRLRNRLTDRLQAMEEMGDDAVIVIMAKNSTMYDKIFQLLGLET